MTLIFKVQEEGVVSSC